MKNVFTIIFLLFFLTHIISAQYTDLNFKNFSKEEGLSVCFITSILQDRDGFLWFGTYGGGINRFDGYSFKSYNNVTDRKGSSSISFIKTLYEDSNGIIWIGTYNEGLSRFDKNTEQFINYFHNPGDSNSISGNTVNSIYIDSKGIMWVGCESDGLNKFDEKNNRFIHYRSDINDTAGIKGESVRAICEDRAGNLWFGTDKGLNRFDRKSEVFFHYTIRGSDASDVRDYNNITRLIYSDKDDAIWIGSATGLNKFTYLSEEQYYFRTYHINKTDGIHVSSIYIDNYGFLWIGTNGHGLYILNPVTEELINYRSDIKNKNSIPNDRMSSNTIIEDRSGNIWLGTNFGASMCSRQKKKFGFYRYNESIPGWTIFEDKNNNVWITGKNNFHIRDSSGIFKVVSYKPPVKSFMTGNWGYKGICDKSGVIWLGYQNVLCKYNRTTGKLDHFYSFLDENNLPEPIIKVIFEDSENLLWIGTTKGVRVFNKDRTNSVKYVHDSNNPFSIGSSGTHCYIYEDKTGAIWISLPNKGVDKFDKKTGRFEHYQNDPSDSNSLSNNFVCSLYDDGKGNIWIAACAGLDKLNLNTKKFTHYTEKDGLADNYTYSILPDNSGNLWISTNSGISKFNPLTNTFNNYNKSDGLQNDEYTDVAYKTSKGELFFSGMLGINSFFPDSIAENKHIPPVYITSFKIFDREAELDKSVTITDEIKLSYKENFFTFEFAALDFTNPELNQYTYILEGVDKGWHHLGNVRRANYTDIDPGEYTFRVKGSNNDGVWNEKGASVKIIIAPPFWATWWFRTLYILFFLVTIGFILHNRHNKVKKELSRQKEFTKQLIESQEQERKRIASELHDGLGQNLLIIQNKILSEMNNQNGESRLKDISKLTEETIQEIRTISYNLHPYQLEQLGLTKAIKSIINRASESAKIKFNYDVDNIDKLFSSEIEINIFRMVQEGINNALEHSNATEIYISVLKGVKEISIHIKDNGVGFNLPENSDKGLGIKSLNERAKFCNAMAEIDSRPGKGTLVDISIPVPENKK